MARKKPPQTPKNPHAQAMAKRRAASMTPERRHEIAMMGVVARLAKTRKAAREARKISLAQVDKPE